MKKCPVCNNQLPELIPEFCDVCGWDVGEDLSLQPILNMPDKEDIARYKRRLENAKKIWEKKLEKESLLEKKLQEVKKEKTQTIVIPEQKVMVQENTNDNMENQKDYFASGMEYFYKSDYKSAITDFINLIKIDVNNKLAYQMRGISYYKMKDYENAIKDFTEVIRKDSKFDCAFLMRGHVYGEINNIEEKKKDYIIAARLGNNVAKEWLEKNYKDISKRNYWF